KALSTLAYYVTQVTLISLFVNTLVQAQNEEQLVYTGILLLSATIFIVALTRTKYISTKFNRFVEKVLSQKIKNQKKLSVDQILKVSKGFGVFEFLLEGNNPYCNVALNDTKLSNMQVHVLKVDRGGKAIDFPEATFVLKQGDRVVLYGKTTSATQIALGKIKKTA
ncbi:MAG: TrkA C-terminal domain-containing protein, partial [Clostridiales bacterium]|nr:TrkA C-terminal domain-containing protein [Clostridiales bacterium]